jgi:hypothetical protein
MRYGGDFRRRLGREEHEPDIALWLQPMLQNLGYNVVLDRTGDYR